MSADQWREDWLANVRSAITSAASSEALDQIHVHVSAVAELGLIPAEDAAKLADELNGAVAEMLLAASAARSER